MEKNKKSEVTAKRLRSEAKQELQTRREFFKKAAKGTLPVLGAIALSGVPIISIASERNPMECSCTAGCQTACQRGCARDCYAACADSCSGRCKGCQGNCYGDCVGNCKDTCQGGCQNSCSGSCQNSCAGSSK